jgi:hypothetical protein
LRSCTIPPLSIQCPPTITPLSLIAFGKKPLRWVIVSVQVQVKVDSSGCGQQPGLSARSGGRPARQVQLSVAGNRHSAGCDGAHVIIAGVGIRCDDPAFRLPVHRRRHGSAQAWGPGPPGSRPPLSHRYRKKPVWCVVRVLRRGTRSRPFCSWLMPAVYLSASVPPVVAVPGSRPYGPGSASRPPGLSPGTRRWPPSEDGPRIGGTWLGGRPRAAGWRPQGGGHQDGPADEGEYRDRLDRQRFGGHRDSM